ncbi:DUF488 family protein [Planctomyces sp. SH-PL14]|uniref:DUF488 domain-containing protein n=1 Tax=Planctomyces sp. SH-PL14 TaxID=1632864 RepID=UPI00078CCDC1|nr:DUF488 domain-containing protein [Planctomyces sp. SH-PL14]AMV19049.1 hypothetical protein VT03_14255 [Planctomyces sp. SH-PL14]
MQNSSRQVLFTVGHSTRSLGEFVSLLWKNDVTAVVDVRSKPSSRLQQFCQAELSSHLRECAIQYVFLGKELGARRVEQSCYVGGQARYDRIRELPLFRSGMDRVCRGLEGYRIALLCAERDPITCHRMILVSRELRGLDIEIRHIINQDTVESNAQAERRLLKAVGIAERDLFVPVDDLIERAYDLQADRIAYASQDMRAEGTE